MRDLIPTFIQWAAEGQRFALAVVVGSGGSSPRGVGAAMAVREDGLMAGSVSGGCVEGAVVETSRRSLKSGDGELLEFGPETEASMFEVGLSCGGSVRIWVCPFPPELIESLKEGVEQRLPLSLHFNLNPQNPVISATSGQEDVEGVFILNIPAPERLVVVGAVHIAMFLLRLAKELGFETIVVDPRQAFARPDRFPTAPDRLIHEWPDKAFAEIGLDEHTYVVALTHDPKIDDATLKLALPSQAAYVGALGSSRTQSKKRERLIAEGLREADVDRLHGPIGLDIGAQTPEEIAVSILAEIVRFRRRA